MTNLHIERLAPTIGAVVHDIDLAEALDDRAVRSLQDALIGHKVLFFRDQHLSHAQQRDFAARFGALHVHPFVKNVSDVPEIMVVETLPGQPTYNDIWHTDVTFIETPPLGSVLYARELPEIGGDTMWADAEAAYQALSPSFRAFLETLRAEHSYARAFTEETVYVEDAAERLKKARTDLPPVVHPVVRTHPVTGRKAIFVNPCFTTRILGVTRDESRLILSHLHKIVPKPEHTVRWRWRANDIAFWDNRNTQHYALADYGEQRRRMERATILGDRPV
jgi:taurine dioxygenase